MRIIANLKLCDKSRRCKFCTKIALFNNFLVQYFQISFGNEKWIFLFSTLALYVFVLLRGKGWRKLTKLLRHIHVYKEIQSGAVTKSYMRNGFLIYEEMRQYFPIYEEAVSHIWFCNCSIVNFLIYEENLIFFFISVQWMVTTVFHETYLVVVRWGKKMVILM